MLLLISGYLTIYSSSFKGLDVQESYWSSSYGKQMIWIIISIVIGSFILLIEGSFIQNISYLTYAFIGFLLIIVLFMPPVKGVSSWFQFGGFSIQPSEFAKLATSLAFAKFLSNVNSRFQDFKTRIKAGLLVFFPAILIILQPDAGTMLVFVGFVFVLYREGLSGNFLLIGLFAVLIATVGIFLKASNSNISISNWEISGNIFFWFCFNP